MGNYTGANTWETDVYQFDETDIVQGGPLGIDNVPLKQLANRTKFLYNKIGFADHFNGYRDISNNDNIAPANAGQVQCAFGAGATDITMNDASDFEHGAIIPIACYCNGNSVVRIIPSNGQKFYFLGGQRSFLYMHNNESLFIIALTNHFKIMNACGNFECVGEEIKSRKALNNTVPLSGQLLSRVLFPRLWEFAQTLTMGQEITDEGSYFSDPFLLKGLFTTGNGTSNFRVPDERGTFDRMIDLDRGFDLSRPHKFPGGYQSDANKQHAHPYRDRYYAESNNVPTAAFKEPMPANYNGRVGAGDSDADNTVFLYIDSTSGNSGDNESRPRNVGKINLMKF